MRREKREKSTENKEKPGDKGGRGSCVVQIRNAVFRCHADAMLDEAEKPKSILNEGEEESRDPSRKSCVSCIVCRVSCVVCRVSCPSPSHAGRGRPSCARPQWLASKAHTSFVLTQVPVFNDIAACPSPVWHSSREGVVFGHERESTHGRRCRCRDQAVVAHQEVG